MWASTRHKPGMLNDERIVNIFYTDHKPLTDYKIKSYEDVDCRFLGENGKNKIPSIALGGDIFQYLVPLVHEDAVVQIFNRDVQTSITWVPQEDRWELLTVVTTGAKLIQAKGVSLITANTPFALNP